MQQNLSSQPPLVTACAACGGDPGGLVWEGTVLAGLLTAEAITELLQGVLNHRGVVRLFRKGQLRGAKLGKRWSIRASQFVEDWSRLEAGDRGDAGRARPLPRKEAGR